MTQEQKAAIRTLQDAHGAVLGMMNHLKSDAPAWVVENAKKTINESIAACKVTTPMLVDEVNESVLIRIRVVPNPAAKTPVREMGIGNHDVGVTGKTALLRHLIPAAQLNHDTLGCCITVDDGGLRLSKLVRCFLHDGYSVFLENA